MRLLLIVALAGFVAVLAACTSEGQGQISNKGKSVTKGPCVANLCLGTDGAGYLASCGTTTEVINGINLRSCQIKRRLSIAGVTSTSGVATIVDGQVARLKLRFDHSSCSLLTPLLEKSLGESTVYNHYLPDRYWDTFNLIGSPFYINDPYARQWVSQSGRFILSGADVNGCDLNVDSDNVVTNIGRKIKSEVNGSIRG